MMRTKAYFKLTDEVTNPEGMDILNTEYIHGVEKEFAMVFDGVDVDDILRDVLDAGEAIQKHFIEMQIHTERYTEHVLPIDVFIVAEVLGMELEQQTTIDEQKFNELKSDEEPEPELNQESLQNDIQQVIPMIQTMQSDDDKPGVLQWVHHILNKHFQTPMPPEHVPLTAEEQAERDKFANDMAESHSI